jgi:conjugative relaxase-like TrwC/TraI family protein
MLSISKPMSATAAADYYEKTGKEEYYLAEKGTYGGKLAETLGVNQQEVSRDNFKTLLDGKSPETGDQLVGASKSNDERRAGWDLTFSAPKSVSILAIEDPRLKSAHDQAVKETMAMVEDRYAITRVADGVGGQIKENTGNLAYASFVHHSSRVQDPQLHTHNFVFNMTDKGDGKFGGLELRDLYKDQKSIGQEYRSILASKAKELGYAIEITDRKDGLFEIKGVDEKLIKEFSGRRQAIEKQVEFLKSSGQYPDASHASLHEIANLQTRPAKAPANATELRHDWDRRVDEVTGGKTINQIMNHARELGKGQHLIQSNERAALTDAAVTNAIVALTSTESIFSSRDLVTAVQRLTLEHGVTSNEVDQSISRLESRNELLRTKSNELTKSASFTTPEMVKAEWTVLNLVQESMKTRYFRIGEETINGRLDSLTQPLTSGQSNAVKEILNGHNGISVIQGDAGTGKTAAMKVVRELADEHGIFVRGLAFTGKAVDELQQGAGIEGKTLASYLGKSAKPSGRPEIWIVDEAGMVGAKDMATVLSLAKESDAKVILVGDVKQFLPISAGRSFEQAQKELGVSVVLMDEAMRPKTDLMREVFSHAAAGRTDQAIDVLSQHGKAVEVADRGERIKAVAADYIQTTASGQSALILTARNNDRNEINEYVRGELVGSGRVAQGDSYNVLTSRGLSGVEARFADQYKVGDQLKMFDKVSAVSAGTVAKVVGIDATKNRLTLAYSTKDGIQHTVNIDPAKQADKYAVFEQKSRSFGVGDRIVALSNDKKLVIQNGATGTIMALENDNATIMLDSGENRTINLKQYNYIDHGYAVTEYKSQGTTVDKTIIHADTTHNLSRNSFYVGVTRGRSDAAIYTDNVQSYREQVKEAAQKSSALDYRDALSIKPVLAGLNKEIEIDRHLPPNQISDQSQVLSSPTFTKVSDRSIYSSSPSKLGAGYRSQIGWDARVGGVGFAAEKNGWLGVGDISFHSGNTERSFGVKTVTDSKVVLSGENKGSVVHSKTLFHGDQWGGHYSGSGSVSKKDGQKVKVQESGYHTNLGISRFTHHKRVETAKDGTKQISNTKSFLWSVWGEKKTISPDGTIRVTNWKGTKSALTGKIKITHSVTKTYIDHKEAYRHTQPLSKRLFEAVASRVMLVSGKLFGATDEQIADIKRFINKEESKDSLVTVRDNISGKFSKTGSVERSDGTRISLNEQGWRQGDSILSRRVENIVDGNWSGATKIVEQELRHVDGKAVLAGVTQSISPNGNKQEKWSAEKDKNGKWVTRGRDKIPKQMEKFNNKTIEMER